jgi:hypothetical protein
MPAKDSRNIVDSAVPKPDPANRLVEGEKKALELSEQAEHSHGAERERLQQQAGEAADGDNG